MGHLQMGGGGKCCSLVVATKVGGKHPTGMHSC